MDLLQQFWFRNFFALQLNLIDLHSYFISKEHYVLQKIKYIMEQV